MSKSDTTAVLPGPIDAIILQHGAVPVLLAALKALLRRPQRAASHQPDVRFLNSYMLRDIGLRGLDDKDDFARRSP